MNNLDNDYFVYDQVHHKLTGERTGVEYSLGTLVTVCVAKVDVDERKIDFTLEKSEKRIRRSMKKAFEKKIKKKKSKQEETKPGKKAKLKSSKKLKPKSAKTKKTKAKRK